MTPAPGSVAELGVEGGEMILRLESREIPEISQAERRISARGALQERRRLQARAEQIGRAHV